MSGQISGLFKCLFNIIFLQVKLVGSFLYVAPDITFFHKRSSLLTGSLSDEWNKFYDIDTSLSSPETPLTVSTLT
jgi:hypothetical protein